jgi:2,4-dienoyl-CoA reductase-like NADH-dependent reductase (Old Yellow Enzyme family)
VPGVRYPHFATLFIQSLSNFMSQLFSPLQIRDITFRNRIWVAPMCQYSSQDGFPTDWHLVHLGSRAVGGAGLVIQEATAVSPEGRISPSDAGIWSDEHIEAYARIAKFIKAEGSVAGIQLAHAGRKASTSEPWNGGSQVEDSAERWQPIGPSDVAFADDYPIPRAMTEEDIDRVTTTFVDSARRSVEAGFEMIEVHAAHGYLLHEFLSPLTNTRDDQYGGSLENRMRFPLAVVRRIRDAVPDRLPIFVRISASDWVEQGWDIEQSIEFCKACKTLSVDLIDVSSGGNVSDAKIPVGAGYQVEFARSIRQSADILTGAVGLITEPQQAEQILRTGQADAVLMAREFLREPYFPFRAAAQLRAEIDYVPKQYRRAIHV